MNTIHTIFNEVNTSYTVIGGHSPKKELQGKGFISALLLSRGGRPFREELLEELYHLGIEEIISTHLASGHPIDFEKEFMDKDILRSIVFKDGISTGEIINIGISECRGDYVFILWDDMNIDSKLISNRVIEKIKERDRICTPPLYRIKEGEIFPTIMTPLFDKGILKIIPLDKTNNLKTIYPFQYTGIYSKKKFTNLGGYDINIKNTYWQKLDFGVRANMWGEEIVINKYFHIELSSTEDYIEDITPDESYRLYSLKNLSVVVNRDHGFLPMRKFFAYLDKSGSSFYEGYKTFKEVRDWVKRNSSNFKHSAISLTENWNQ